MGVVFFGITVISFWVIHLAPGSPTDLQTTLNPEAGLEARAQLEKLYGLDQPLHIQYGKWLNRLVHLDFGQSMSGDHRPVWDKIRERLPLTFGMNVASMILTLLIAVPIGVTAAWWRGGTFDKVSTIIVFMGFAMPGFWLALLLMLWLGIQWPILPISGLTSLGYDAMSPMEKYGTSPSTSSCQSSFILPAHGRVCPDSCAHPCLKSSDRTTS